MEANAMREYLGTPPNDERVLDVAIVTMTGIPLVKLEYGREAGYRIKETGGHYIDVMPMLYNWRIVISRTESPGVPIRGWCYQGTGLDGFVPAVLAAIAWDGSDDTEPPGYFKRAGA